MSNAEPNFTGGGSVFGWLVAQWQTFLGSKVDALNGYSTNQTLTNPSINGVPIPTNIVTAVTPPLTLSTGTAGLDIAATLAVVGGALDFANESANLVLAGPTSGSATKPTFRALVVADLPGGGTVTSFNSRTGAIAPAATDYATFMRGYIGGLTLSNDGTSPNTVLDISPGSANDSTNAITMQIGAFTKTTGGAWVAGSGNAGMGNGLTITVNTWYQVFLIINAGSADVYFDTSVTAGNAPSSTTYYRRIGSFKTAVASTNILAFSQNGDEFLWGTPISDMTNVGAATGTQMQAFTVPPGVRTNVLLTLNASYAGTNTGFAFWSPDAGSGPYQVYVNSTATTEATSISPRVNTSRQLNWTASSSGASTISAANTGYVDMRGRFA